MGTLEYMVRLVPDCPPTDDLMLPSMAPPMIHFIFMHVHHL